MQIERESFLAKSVIRSIKDSQGKPLIAAGYGAWGMPVTNDVLLQKFSAGKNEKEIELLSTTLENTGIEVRYLPKMRYRLSDQRGKIDEDLVRAGIEMTQLVLKEKAWDSADFLVVATSQPPEEKNFWVDEIASKCKVSLKHTFLSSAACNSAVASLHEVLNREELKDSRVVITAIEALGHFSREGDLLEQTIFGNGTSSIAFVPKSIELLSGKTLVQVDEETYISSPHFRDLPKDPIEDYPWLEVKEGSGQRFAHTKKEFMLHLPLSSGDYLEMDGSKTTRHFIDFSSSLILSVLGEYYECGNRRSVRWSVQHQPSAGVFMLANRKVNKNLTRLGLPVIEEAPWVLTQAYMSNTSSPTTFVTLAELSQKLPIGEPVNITAYGAGSSGTSLIVSFKSS